MQGTGEFEPSLTSLLLREQSPKHFTPHFPTVDVITTSLISEWRLQLVDPGQVPGVRRTPPPDQDRQRLSSPRARVILPLLQATQRHHHRQAEQVSKF